MVGFSIPADVSLDRLLAAANEQNRETKVVKIDVYLLPEDGHVSFSTEMFFGEAKVWEPIFARALAALRVASDEYYGSLKEALVARRPLLNLDRLSSYATRVRNCPGAARPRPGPVRGDRAGHSRSRRCGIGRGFADSLGTEDPASR
jgi:hypothetical protein